MNKYINKYTTPPNLLSLRQRAEGKHRTRKKLTHKSHSHDDEMSTTSNTDSNHNGPNDSGRVITGSAGHIGKISFVDSELDTTFSTLNLIFDKLKKRCATRTSLWR